MPQRIRPREPARQGRDPRYLGPPPRARRRRLLAAATVFAAVIVVVVVLLTTGGSSGRKARAGAKNPPTRASHTTPHRTQPQTVTHRQPAPGTLPQTHARPSSTTPQFNSQMAALWAGVVRNSTARAMPAFFPEAAYLRVKALPYDASANFKDFLVHDFALDIGAAHALLGAGAGGARLLAVHVPREFVHWVDPRGCYNRVGYYEVPNARVVYTENGHVHSFGVASMISWRGVWYVIHFGAVGHSGAGVVDAPSAGPGTSIDTGTC